jgi:phosphoribosylaminoimidazolecarboxamide formyltransferase/IMP cyclohydrolase
LDEALPVRRALLAVYDKSGLIPFATGLVDLGVSVVSSGGTAQVLRDAGLEVISVEEVTGFPEMLGGRVKTLHPKIHGGILADRRKPEHEAELEVHGIEPFDLVVVNLYPFRETVASGAGPDEVVENIDIGGPAMIRAAAKNFESVGAVTSPERYAFVLDEIRRTGGLARETRRELAAEAFAHTAAYDAAVATWFAPHEDALPDFVGLALRKTHDLRYGENPHQRGALYEEIASPGPFGGARVVIEGKEMSFNNWLDVQAAHALAEALARPAAVIVKHNNPCGAAVASSLAEAYERAFACDSVSAFGGIVAFNEDTNEDAARAMAEVFTEVVVAPGFTRGALDALRQRKGLRVVQIAPKSAVGGGLDVRTFAGGALVQDRDDVAETRDLMEIVSAREPDEDEWRDLLLAWTVAAHVKSNAIVFAKDGATVGIGAGQMSRVDASWMAVRKAGDRAKGAVMASDAFFPFPDAVEVAAEAGVTAVIHPGGSIRDEDVLVAAEGHGMAVVVTGRRHFRH